MNLFGYGVVECRGSGGGGVEPEEGVDEELRRGQEQVDRQQREDPADQRGGAHHGPPLPGPGLREAEEGGEQTLRVVHRHDPVRPDLGRIQPEPSQSSAHYKPNP